MLQRKARDDKMTGKYKHITRVISAPQEYARKRRSGRFLVCAFRSGFGNQCIRAQSIIGINALFAKTVFYLI